MLRSSLHNHPSLLSAKCVEKVIPTPLYCQLAFQGEALGFHLAERTTDKPVSQSSAQSFSVPFSQRDVHVSNLNPQKCLYPGCSAILTSIDLWHAIATGNILFSIFQASISRTNPSDPEISCTKLEQALITHKPVLGLSIIKEKQTMAFLKFL